MLAFWIISLINLKKIYIASDHAGFNLKNYILRKLNTKFNIMDLGTHNNSTSVNYPYYAHKLSKLVSANKSNIGILVCGSGLGMSMAANRHKKIRAALCYSVKNAKLSRLHNDANIITLGSRLISKKNAFKFVKIFLNTKFDGGRHLRRVKKI